MNCTNNYAIKEYAYLPMYALNFEILSSSWNTF